jgi:hypothetical protein
MIVFITDIVHQALTKITCSSAVIAYRCKTSIYCISGFTTELPTKIQNMVEWLNTKDMIKSPTNVPEVSSMFLSSLIIVLTINLELQVEIGSDCNCGSYSVDILPWHTRYGNPRQIID